mmetsp:Transcript_6150/g.12878  ORF Transcript_6150/g.12878 Transcript_6150/m.12878 type:complete len:317 (-) Transcript_6150:98-1048(-)
MMYRVASACLISSPIVAAFSPTLYDSSLSSIFPAMADRDAKRAEDASAAAALSVGSTASLSAATSSVATDTPSDTVTVLGFGSLLSVKSSRLTFPDLRNFRLGRVPDHRRVFGHPASIFFQRGIADADTLEFSSLCAERDPAEEGEGEGGGPGFICAVFEVPNDGMMEDPDGSGRLVPSEAFLEREEEFDIEMVPYRELDDDGTPRAEGGEGILCLRSTDESYLRRWGQERFHEQYGKYGVNTVWGWERDSGLRPCAPYLRHCVLAAEKMGSVCLDSFLDETFLVDRRTTVREYLKKHPEIMERLPPPFLAERYGG